MFSKIQSTLFTAKRFNDSRGILYHFNDLNLEPVKRTYIIEHPDINIVRAWQGHKMEQKWFRVIAGSFKIVLVKPDDWKSPAENLGFEEFNLMAENCQVLHITGGYANGIKALESNSRLMVFSDFSMEESALDNFRFDKNRWYNWDR